MNRRTARVARLLSRVAVVLMFAFLLVTATEQARAQSWGESWGVRTTTPRSVAGGPLWITPSVVQGLRSDRLYSLVVTGSIKLGDEHYGKYYKGYYGDGGYRWESTARDINYPTIAPQRSGVVATNLGIGLADTSYQRNHIYYTGWFTPSSSSMTIQLAVRPSRDNQGQIHYSLIELHPDADPADYTFNSASASWYYNGDLAGQRPVQGVAQDSIQDLFSSFTQAISGSGNNNGASNGLDPIGASASNDLWGAGSSTGWNQGSSSGGIGNNGLFGDGALPPMFEPSGTCTDSHDSMFGESGLGPADVQVGPGFESTPRPGNSGSGYNGNAINLLDQIASPVM